MQIHVVSPGETVFSIARKYDVSPSLLTQQNQIPGGQLAAGQTLVVYEPLRVHTVQPGETLSAIARQEGVSVLTLLRNNYFLEGQSDLWPGQTLIVSLSAPPLGQLTVNGYAYPHISDGLLRAELPYLSHLTPFTYGITREGHLVPLRDERLLAPTSQYGVMPWMHLSTLTAQDRFDSALGAALLTDEAAREVLINEVIANMQEKGYTGLDVDFEFLPAQQTEDYAAFIAALRQRLQPLGKTVIVALAPKTYAAQPGLLYEAHNYAALSAAADAVLLMTYEWRYTAGPPMAVAPLPNVRRVLDYALTEMPPEKILLGIPTYGYDWPLPYRRGETRATSLSPTEALQLAISYGAEIQFDESAQTPWFRYTAADGIVHEVWFEDARSAESKLTLALESGLQGVGLWNLMRRAPQFYLVLHALAQIRNAP